jgi:RNA polymerase sigma-70 factor (ECF subfamily)
VNIRRPSWTRDGAATREEADAEAPGNEPDSPKVGADRHADGVRPRLHTVHDTTAYPDWNAIYRDNVDRVYRLMLSKVGNRPDAEDLTAEVFLAALRPLRSNAAVGEVRAYLLATARTVLAGYWRRRLGHQVTTLDDDTESLPTATEVSRHDEEQVREILAILPDRYRQILELRFLHGYTVRQAADELGISTSNAKVLQHRALRHAAHLGKERQ